MEFNQVLTVLRKEKKVSQETIANIANVTPGAVSSWELGKYEPNMRILRALADYFHVSVDELIGRIELGSEYNHFTDDELSMIQKYRMASEQNREWIRSCFEKIE